MTATARVTTGDCMSVLPDLEPETFHACVTDPPYDLVSIVKRFGKPGSAPCQHRTDGAFARASRGFMGKEWDGTGIAFQPETWAAVARVLKPGAHVLAFGGDRTHHRMMVAMEDGGLEIRRVIAWVYATGFPKSKNLSGEWEGWGSDLKPAFEPIILARKPLSEKSIQANAEKHGTGALNIEASRIQRAEGDVPGWHKTGSDGTGGYQGTDTFKARQMSAEEIQERCGGGRWPSNLILSHSADCNGTCADDCPVRLLDEQSGLSKSGSYKGEGCKSGGIWSQSTGKPAGPEYGDEGGASRFFRQFPPFIYEAKPSRAERDRGCGSLPQKVGGIRSETSGQHITRRDGGAPGPVSNHHPTVKPVALLRYLVRLVTPPDGAVLDPFCGSGTTGMACLDEGFSFVGIEKEVDYAEIARARIAACANLFGAAAEDAPLSEPELFRRWWELSGRDLTPAEASERERLAPLVGARRSRAKA